jgi:CRISPR system Cascade subunit CasD
MVLGLLGNALGLDRTRTSDMQRLDRLQAGTRISVLMLSEPSVWTDVQNARVPAEQLDDVETRLERGGRISDDPGLASIGPVPEVKRLKKFLDKPVQRRKQYLTDLHALVAISPNGDWPGAVEDLAAALRRPARVLWVGRKACPPSAPILPLVPLVEADSGADALARSLGEDIERVALEKHRSRPDEGLVLWWEGEPEPGSPAALALGIKGGFPTAILDRRDWVQGLHSRTSTLWRGTLAVSASTVPAVA